MLQALYHWWITRSPRDELFHQMNNANSFEEWIQAAIQQDRLLDYELWRQNPTSKFYDYELIYDRMHAIVDAEDDMDILISALRSGLIRNLGNITAPKLFTRAYTGTKVLIERYITNVVLAIDDIVNYPVSRATGFTNQAKLDLLHDTRQSFGRSALVLQGGAIFGLCHIGVVKALHLRGLLPRIISGTATGALIAALVGVHTEEELPEFLKGSSINVTAFTKHLEKDRAGKSDSWWETLFRRVNRFFREGEQNPEALELQLAMLTVYQATSLTSAFLNKFSKPTSETSHSKKRTQEQNVFSTSPSPPRVMALSQTC
jgi:TAG lipase/lysophosphatidylethanolamine acyltransferase